MNQPFIQTDGQGRLYTSFGDDALVLKRLDGFEALCGEFEWAVEALSDQGGLDLHALLGTHATVEVDHAHGTRYFDGIVCEAVHRGAMENGWRYDLVLRPWLHVASLRRNMRIFHNKTVVDIIEEVLSSYGDMGKPHLEVQLDDDYPTLEYTVQYGESDADFVCRQMERFGITWSWRHGLETHTLVLTDASSSLPMVPGDSRAYIGVQDFHEADEEHFRNWASAERIQTGAVKLTEYNFKTPKAQQMVQQPGSATHSSGDIESYDWPGDYLDHGEGKTVIARRVDAEQGQIPRHLAEGDALSLGAGMRVTLEGDEVPGATGQTFVCLRAEHRIRARDYGTVEGEGQEKPYDGTYQLLPETAPYRPELRRQSPRVQGPETAVVVGEGEIDCDEHGRILARFHWDLDGSNTMRVRVSQNWAGKGWGGMVIPRIGMEVIIEHLRGDPDKPIVMGCVYNGENTPPYDLPANKTRSTFKTDTHQGQGFNELRFEDEKDQEEIFLHAQKDMNVQVLNNREKRVDVNEFESIGANKSAEIGNNMTVKVGGNYSFVVGANKALDFISNVHQRFTGFLGEKAKQLGVPGFINLGKGNYNELIGMNKSEVVTLAKQEAVGLSRTTTVGRNAQEFIGHNKHVFVAGSSMQEAAKTSTMVAGETWQVACGSGAIVIHSDGKVEIKGTAIDIVADTTVRINGQDVQIN